MNAPPCFQVNPWFARLDRYGSALTAGGRRLHLFNAGLTSWRLTSRINTLVVRSKAAKRRRPRRRPSIFGLGRHKKRKSSSRNARYSRVVRGTQLMANTQHSPLIHKATPRWCSSHAPSIYSIPHTCDCCSCHHEQEDLEATKILVEDEKRDLEARSEAIAHAVELAEDGDSEKDRYNCDRSTGYQKQKALPCLTSSPPPHTLLIV